MSNASISTVSGSIPPIDLGVTLFHEHLAMRPGNLEKYRESFLEDTGKMVQEVASYAEAGGESIIEMSAIGFNRDVRAYREISEQTDVHVICATGFSKEELVPDWVTRKNDEEIYQILFGELHAGVGDTGIRPGILKVGTSHHQITELERRLIGIVARVHHSTSVPISTHCDKGTMAAEQGELLLENGVDPGHIVLGHVDIPNDAESLAHLCSLGFNVGIDHVGRDRQEDDRAKIPMILYLIDCGYIDHIFLSGDMGKKSYLKAYGGDPGLAYIITELKSSLVSSGVAEAQVRHILRDNPRRIFSVTAG